MHPTGRMGDINVDSFADGSVVRYRLGWCRTAARPSGRRVRDVTGTDGDDTDALVGQWAAVVPRINPRVEGVVDRILISARFLERLTQQLAAPHDLMPADYEILARLFWVGPPHRLRPSQLAAGTMTPATTVTSRLDRLERRGLLRRGSDPTDRRAVIAELTGEGSELFSRIVAEQAAAEEEIFAALPAEDLTRLAALLSETLVALEGRLGPAPRRVRLALGD